MAARLVFRNILYTCVLLSSFTLFLLYMSMSHREEARRSIRYEDEMERRQINRPIYSKTRVFPQSGGDVRFDQPWMIAPKNIINDSMYFIEAKDRRFIVGDFSYSNGLGNLMFQYASLRALARKNKARLVLPEKCLLRRAFDLDAIFVTEDTVIQLMIDYTENAVDVKDCCRYQKLNDLFVKENVVIVSGYLQSPKYFDEPEDFHLIRAQFMFLNEIQKQAAQIMSNYISKRILSIAKPLTDDAQSETFWVGVHIRHGMDITMHSRNLEYGHVAPPLEYFTNAMAEMRKRHDNVAFLVCSDDIDWAVRNIKPQQEGEIFFCQRNSPREIDLALLAKTDGLIISPGTYSWWAAWLSRSIEVFYYFGWPREGSPLDRQMNRSEYYSKEWMPFQ